MKRKSAVLLFTIVAIACTAFAADNTPVVGGQPMYPTKDIIDNAVNSADHTTLVAAVKAAGLVDTLKGPGPFTVFAPTNEAFAKLPAGTVETLLKPENKDMLTKIPQFLGTEERNPRRTRASNPEDRQRRHAHRHDAGIEHRPERRKGRHVDRDHRQRVSIERRHPGRRHRTPAQLTRPQSQRPRGCFIATLRVPHPSFAFCAKEDGAFDFRSSEPYQKRCSGR
jgi:hypothetical protein